MTDAGQHAMSDPSKLLIAGDWHGNTTWARTIIDYADRQGCDTILQLGDFGWWVDNPKTDQFLRAVRRDLVDYDISLYWLDGNHEDHTRTVEWARPGTDALDPIVYLPRGYRWRWWGETWMAVGGGVSMDKHWRVEGESWWPQEQLTPEQLDYCCRPGHVDIIVSHDCPSGVDIPGIGTTTKGTYWPTDVLHEAEVHRERLRHAWTATGATRLYHGHYHVHHETPLGRGLVTGLDRDGSTIREHTRILTPGGAS